VVPLALLAGSAAAAHAHARACRFREHRLQQEAARTVARVTEARFVVMGHSHIPCRVRLPDRRTYFNVGRTLPRASREDWTQGLVVWSDGERQLALRVREFLDLEGIERRSRPTLQPGGLPAPHLA
jgi:UDP-2,3-diacylglucosamine pyrophosphatase LpxH